MVVRGGRALLPSVVVAVVGCSGGPRDGDTHLPAPGSEGCWLWGTLELPFSEGSLSLGSILLLWAAHIQPLVDIGKKENRSPLTPKWNNKDPSQLLSFSEVRWASIAAVSQPSFFLFNPPSLIFSQALLLTHSTVNFVCARFRTRIHILENSPSEAGRWSSKDELDS